MDLVHNDIFILKDKLEGMPAGKYRVLGAFPSENMFFVYRILVPLSGSMKEYSGVSNFYHLQFSVVKKALKQCLIAHMESSTKPNFLNVRENSKAHDIAIMRCKVMEKFLNLSSLNEMLLKYKSLQPVVLSVSIEESISKQSIWKYITLLATHGWFKESLTPGYDRCGGAGKRRFSKDGLRHHGKQSVEDKIESIRQGGRIYLQPAVTQDEYWKVVEAYKSLFDGKKWPPEEDMYRDIIERAFVTSFEDVGGFPRPIMKQNQYLNLKQVMRICKEVSKDHSLNVHKKSKNQKILKGKALFGSAQSLVSGPGHVYAIDATVGDTYLVCSWDRSKDLRRPTVYFVVDVYSSAIVSYSISLEPPSKKMFDLVLFSVGCPQDIMNRIRGFEGKKAFTTEILRPVSLLSDNGEAKQVGVSQDASIQNIHQAFAPPYRGDMKGIVEVKFSLLSLGLEKQPGGFNAYTDKYDRKRIQGQAALTLQEYIRVVDNWVYQYNTTADRTSLLTPQLRSLGCDGSPASIYDCGKPFSRSGGRFDIDSSISTYLPTLDASQTANGISVNGLDYSNLGNDEHDAALKARNNGRSEIKIAYHPHSLDQIWVPNGSGNGYIETRVLDKSGGSLLKLSLWEYEVFSNEKTICANKLRHEALTTGIAINRLNKEIAKNSIKKKKEDVGNHNGNDGLDVSERRSVEVGINDLSRQSKKLTKATNNAKVNSSEDIELLREFMVDG